MKIFHDSLGTYTVVLAIQNVSKCIAKIKTARNVSANNCGNDRCYAEIRKAPVGAYKPTEEDVSAKGQFKVLCLSACTLLLEHSVSQSNIYHFHSY